MVWVVFYLCLFKPPLGDTGSRSRLRYEDVEHLFGEQFAVLCLHCPAVGFPKGYVLDCL